jgi:DNA replication protein DnaD
MDFSHFLNYEEVKKNGKTYIKFVKSLVEIEPKLVTFHFGNLFNGDKVLGDNINAVLNDNWKEVFTDMSKDLNETINQIIMNLLNGFFAKVSIEEAFD